MKIQKSNKFLAILLGIVAAISFAMIGLTTSAKADMVEYDKTQVEVYQIAPEINTLTQGYVIKTANDKIVVIDGGVDSFSMDTYLPQAIRAILGLEEGAFFHVDAWFLSHAHSDHIFELAKMLNGYVDENDESLVDGKVEIKVPTSLTDGTPKATTLVTPDNNFTIGKFYFDFPTWNYKSGDTSSCLKNLKDGLEVYAAAHPEVEDFKLTNGAVDVYSELNGKYINRDTIKEGQNIYIDGIRFEIMQTWSYGDGDANNNSMVIRMWVDGQSVMFLNDTGVRSGNRLLDTYGADYLKTDIVQLAHHGQNGADKPVYEAIDADVRLWANFRDLWNADKATTSNQTAAVREWFGLEKLTKSTETDLVAALSTCPNNPSVQADWTKEVLDSMKLSLPYAPAFKDDAGFKMNEGASVRLNEGTGNAGLRFSAKMSAYDDSASYGFVIAPREYFEEYTKDYAQNLIANSGSKAIIDLRCKMLDGAVRKNGNFYEIQGSISMIKYANMNREFTGLAYMLKDGVYTDAEFNSLDYITRSVLDVALKANASGDFDGADNAEDLAIIKSFIHKGVMKEQGVLESDYDANAAINVSLAFKETSASVEYGDSVIAEIETDVDKNLVAYSYDKKLINFDPETGKITPLEVGTATLTASCYDKTATFTVTTDTKDGYYITFENEGTLKDVSLNDRAYRTGNDVKTELATNVTDKIGITEPNAVKITTTASGGGICDLVINLPKEVDVETHKGVTVAINFASTEGTFAIFNVNYWETTNTETGRPILGAKDPVSHSSKGTRPFINATERDAALNTWKYIYVDYITCETDFDKVILAMSGIPANGESVIYVAYVAEGDVSAEKTAAAQEQLMGKLKESLTDGYIAQFDNDLYKDLVTPSGSYYWENNNLKVEILNEFQGEQGVLKISGTVNTYNGDGIVNIRLPKSFETSFTAKFWVSTVDGKVPGLIGFTESINGTYVPGAHWYNSAALAGDTWHTKIVTPTAGGNSINFVLGWANGYKVEAYISFVYNGDATDTLLKEYKTTALKTLNSETGELANFDSDVYANLITLDGVHPAKSWTADVLESAADEQGIIRPNVMKLTIDIISGAPYWSFVNINMPKAHTGSYTLEYFIPSGQFEWSGSGGQVGIKSAGTLSSHDWQTTGVWNSKCFTGSSSDVISIGLLNHSAAKSTSLTIYISAIYDGDKTAYVTEQIYKAALGENEVANFDLPGYTGFVKAHDTTYPPYNFKVEYLETYEGATGVIKLSGQVNSTGNQARLSIQLITPHTGTYTIKYRWGDYVHSDGITTSLAAGRWVTGISDNRVSSTKTFELKGDRDVWNTSVIDTSSLESGTKYIAIQFWGSAVTLSDSSKENCGFVMYIDVIWNGDTTAA